MARRSRRGSSRRSTADARRDTPRIASGVPLLRSLSKSLSLVEDRRHFHPAGDFRPARSRRSANHRLDAADRRLRSPVPVWKSESIPSRVVFHAPKSVLICVRRNRRREVLFASGGASKRHKRRPRRNWFSAVSCRR